MFLAVYIAISRFYWKKKSIFGHIYSPFNMAVLSRAGNPLPLFRQLPTFSTFPYQDFCTQKTYFLYLLVHFP